MSALEPLYCLSLHQPWAELVAAGLKRYETRHWPAPARLLEPGAEVAIHATVRWGPEERRARDRILATLSGQVPDHSLRRLNNPERGCVVAVAEIAWCSVMDQALIRAQRHAEIAVGGWEEGRYAWRLGNARRLLAALPLTGRQGVWTLPASVASSVRLRLS